VVVAGTGEELKSNTVDNDIRIGLDMLCELLPSKTGKEVCITFD